MSNPTEKKGSLKMFVKALSYQFKIKKGHKLLQARLNELSNGYPNLKGGAALRVLAVLFTDEEAALASKMGNDYETAATMAVKTGGDEAHIENTLSEMASKGLIFRRRTEGMTEYHLAPHLGGFLEYQVNNDDPSLGINTGMLFGSGYLDTVYSKNMPHLRTIPIQAEIMPKDTVMPYDDAAAIITGSKSIALGNCLCRRLSEKMGEHCVHSMDTCFAFNDWADYYVEIGIAKYISKDEALEKLARNEREGLVNQIANSQNPELMCSCCSCHCNLFKALREAPGPAAEKISNYVCACDTSTCIKCGTCTTRCPMGAHAIVDGRKEFDAGKCIGCGLCVTTCKTNSCILIKRPDEAQYVPLDTLFDTFVAMGGGENA